MKVTNKTRYKLLAFGFHTDIGYGEDVEILPNQTADVNGPYLGEMGDGDCHVALLGEIVCHEAPDSDAGFQVSPGKPLSLAGGNRGVTVRHYGDMPEEHVLEWRGCNATHVSSL